MSAAGVNKKLSNARRGQSNSMSTFIKIALLKAAEVKQAVYWATACKTRFVAILRLMGGPKPAQKRYLVKVPQLLGSNGTRGILLCNSAGFEKTAIQLHNLPSDYIRCEFLDH